ncbi:MAG: hypothetical protein AAF293_04285 [Pseudomonadota bacterium]
MVDVVEYARERRAELLAEIRKLDWFLKVAEELQGLEPKEVPAGSPKRPSVVERSDQKPAEVKASKDSMPEKATQPAPGTPVYRAEDLDLGPRPVDTIVFKKMLSEMRRTYASDRVPAVDPEQKVAAG